MKYLEGNMSDTTITTGLKSIDSTALEHMKKHISDGNVAKVRELIREYNFSPEVRFEQGDSILHLAVRSSYAEVVKAVLEDIDCSSLFAAQNRRANTPICLAVQLSRPNTQLYDEAARLTLRSRFEEICLLLIDADTNIDLSVSLKNLMRKSAIDYLNKSVRNKVISEALEKKISF